MTSNHNQKASRRDFLKKIALGAAAVNGADLLTDQVVAAASQDQDLTASSVSSELASRPIEFDFTKESAVFQPDRVV